MLSGKISFCIEINSEFWSRASPFRQKQILTGLLVRKIYKKKKKREEDLFIQLLYAWLHLTNNNFPTFVSIEEILDQPILLHKADWTLSISLKNISDKLSRDFIKDLCRFMQPSLISSRTISQETRFSCCQP